MFDVILDRDGILNVDVGYTFRIEDFRFPEGTIEALTLLRDAGARFAIATGQSGIARGKYAVEHMDAFNDHLKEELSKRNITVAAIAFCPHHPDYSADCKCRKPKTDMLRQIETQLGPIKWKQAWGIGDKPSDSEMILAMGGSAVLVRSGPHNNSTRDVYWTDQDPGVAKLKQNVRSFFADNILEAAHIILKQTIK